MKRNTISTSGNSPVSRRGFLKGSAAAATAAGLSPLASLSARSYAQVIGSNEDVRIAVIGFNQRGRDHINAYRKIKGVRIVALCDADEAVLHKMADQLAKPSSTSKPSTSPTSQPTAKGSSGSTTQKSHVATALPTTHPSGKPSGRSGGRAAAFAEGQPATHPSGHPTSRPAPIIIKRFVDDAPAQKPIHPELFTDVRKLLDNKEIDAISTATPNHWHSLIGIWACQAGKDAYVEKPISHNIWEGRKLVEAAAKYKRIVAAGTQSRSNEAVREAFEWVRAGNIGKIRVSRGLCYKRRPSIGKVDGPQPVPSTVDYDLWCGPSPKLPLMRKKLHYDWHWVWPTGNGDLGNQGIHQMDMARWALGEPELAPRVFSIGGRFGYVDDGQTPNTQIVVFDYGKGPLLIFEVRGLPDKTDGKEMDEYKGESIGNIVECEGGTLSGTTVYDNDGKEIKRWEEADPFVQEHFVNFVNAVRDRKPQDLNAPILEGHVSSALCHMGNISYRLGKQEDPEQIREAIKGDKAASETFDRFQTHLDANGVDLKKDEAALGPMLQFDPKTERFVNNDKANELASGEYRKPYVVPENV